MLDMKWTRRHLHHCFDTDCGNHLPALKSNNWNIENIENISIIIILSFVSNTDQIEFKTVITSFVELQWLAFLDF